MKRFIGGAVASVLLLSTIIYSSFAYDKPNDVTWGDRVLLAGDLSYTFDDWKNAGVVNSNYKNATIADKIPFWVSRGNISITASDGSHFADEPNFLMMLDKTSDTLPTGAVNWVAKKNQQLDESNSLNFLYGKDGYPMHYLGKDENVNIKTAIKSIGDKVLPKLNGRTEFLDLLLESVPAQETRGSGLLASDVDISNRVLGTNFKLARDFLYTDNKDRLYIRTPFFQYISGAENKGNIINPRGGMPWDVYYKTQSICTDRLQHSRAP